MQFSMNNTLSNWMTRAEAAAYASVSKDTIDDWAKAGLIVKHKLNSAKCGRVLFDRKDIDKYIKSKMIQVKGGK